MINQPLDLYEIFVNTFAGNLQIFAAVAIIFFAWLGAKFRMPNTIFLSFMVLFVLVMGMIGGGFWWVLVSILVAVVTFLVLTKAWKY